MAPRNANFQPQQSIRPKAIDEPKRFISNNASKAQSPSGKLPVGRLKDCYLPPDAGSVRKINLLGPKAQRSIICFDGATG